MNPHIKYRLKSQEEVLPRFIDNSVILVCRKCFKEYSAITEEECSILASLAQKSGRHILECIQVDFLCNASRTEKLLHSLHQDTKQIMVAACGLGIQTTAALTDLPVIATADSVGAAGHHGIALTDHKCGGCGTCYLNFTGGICPVTDCAKSLLNGQCGGAKNGKCEVDAEKDCAWELIESRLAAQGSRPAFLSAPVQLRDYSKTSLQKIRAHVHAIRSEKSEYGGVHPLPRKERSQHLILENFPAPTEVIIPLSQHIGTPAIPLVQAGDYVKLGQKIGQAQGVLSANVHSSLSGTVTAVENRPHSALGTSLSIVIASDGKDALDGSVIPVSAPLHLAPQEILEIIREKGVVGMGGASFPTAVKLSAGQKIDTVLLNGCECESLLTADHRVMLHYADEVILGLRLIMKAIGAKEGVIAVEDNKADAAELLRQKLQNAPFLRVALLKTRYPQGAEKVLIRSVLGREVPRGGLPAETGVVVCNVSTAKAVADAVASGMPPIARAVTVSGEKVRHPANFMVRVGTPVSALLEHCGADAEAAVKMGGGMMGTPLTDLNVPVLKGTGGIIAVEELPRVSSPCIRCGRCADVCPMALSPLYFAQYAQEEKWEEVKTKNVADCIECGCCEYICPSKLPLIAQIKACKKAIREIK